MAKKKHWTQLPENQARVQAMAEQRAQLRKSSPAAKPASHLSRKQVLLRDLAIKGARAELAEIEQRRVTLVMFLKGEK